MKKFTLLFFCLLIINLLRGQIMQETVELKTINPDLIGNIRNDFLLENSNLANISSPKTQEYYERLFYTCKVWGFVKYFHSATANCSINLDSVFVHKLPAIQTAANNAEFNQILLDLINSPGEPALPTIPLPVVPDSLKYNLNLDWFQDEVFSQPVKDALDTIRSRFRPRLHCLVGVAFFNGNPTFDNDILYNSNTVLYPEESLRILALFRYWNIINYFYPYKNILDQNWDETLAEILPLVTEATTATEYNLALLILAKRINDSHAFTTGGMLLLFSELFIPVLRLHPSKTKRLLQRFTLRFRKSKQVILSVQLMESKLPLCAIVLHFIQKVRMMMLFRQMSSKTYYLGQMIVLPSL